MKGNTVGYYNVKVNMDFCGKVDCDAFRDYIRSGEFNKDIQKVIEERFSQYGTEATVYDIANYVFYEPDYEGRAV